MARTYEHTFGDLHSQAEPSDSVVDLGADVRDTDQTGARINPPPGNPDAGKPDQFGDITPTPKGDDVDDGVDVDLTDASDLTDETEVTPPGEDSDEDLSRLSKPQRDRIMRERRLRQESEERSRRLEAELAQVNQKIDLQVKEAEWRTADEKDDQALTDLRSQKVKAMEEGQTERVVDLDDKILDLKAAKKSRDDQRTAAREAAKKPVAPANNGLRPKAKAWVDKHPAYQTDPLFKDAVHAADRLLYSQGFNPDSDDYYVRMSRMLNESGKFDIDPSYLKKGGQRGGSPRGGGSQGVRQGNTGAVRRGENGRLSVTITQAEKALLAQMGQDPEDPAVLKAFAREKVAQQRADASRGER